MTKTKTMTDVELEDLDMTLTLAEWHRERDTREDVWLVTPHEHQLDIAA